MPSVWFLPRNVWRTVVVAQKSSGEVVLSVVAEGGAAAKCSNRNSLLEEEHVSTHTIWERVHFFPCMHCLMLVNHVD